MRICLVYDHLFPQTVGGAERWMRDLAVHLARSGHDVTYLTMRHWSADAAPDLDGVRVLGLADPGRVYGDARREIGPPLRFGYAVGRHLLVHGSSYDVVHLASFPFFPLVAAGALRRRGGYELEVDWHEVWTRPYWGHYAGSVAGTIGWLVQKWCARLRHTAYCLSRMHAARLVSEGYRGTPVILPGLYAGSTTPTPSSEVDPSLIVYAGRHVREKRVEALVRGFAVALERRPSLRLELYGDGPERHRVEDLVRTTGLGGSVVVRGPRPEAEVAGAIARAACLATASEREGYGLVVVEAAARGTPSVVVAGSENAAVELIEEGVNGTVAATASAEDLGQALVHIVDRGSSLRKTTAAWFTEHASSLRIEGSLEIVAPPSPTSSGVA